MAGTYKYNVHKFGHLVPYLCLVLSLVVMLYFLPKVPVDKSYEQGKLLKLLS